MKTKEQLENLVTLVKGEMTAGPVCDAIFKCAGWEKSMSRYLYPELIEQAGGNPWKYCPWCGKEIHTVKSEGRDAGRK